MATVRFSESLKEDINRNAKKMFEANIDKAKRDVPTHWADKMYQCFFPAEVIAKFKALPDYAMQKEESISFDGFHNEPEDEFQTAEHRTHVYKCDSVRLQFSTAQPWPNTFEKETTGFNSRYSAGTCDFNDTRWDWLKPEFKEYNRKIFEQESKQEKFLEGVKSIINTYSTLAPALKAWPALWDLIPEEAKERHKKIVEKKKAEVADIGADLDGMTAAVTFNKLTK